MLYLEELVESILPMHIFLKCSIIFEVNRDNFPVFNQIVFLFFIDEGSCNCTLDPFFKGFIDEILTPLRDDFILKFLSDVLYNLLHDSLCLSCDCFVGPQGHGHLYLPIFLENRIVVDLVPNDLHGVS